MITNKNLIDSILGRTSTTLNRCLLQKFKEENLSITPERWSVLSILWEKDGCSQQELAFKTYRDKPGITRLLDNLEKEGFTVREADKKDRRLKLVYLTEKGERLQNDVYKIIDEVVDKSVKNIPMSDLMKVSETLDAIYFNLIEK